MIKTAKYNTYIITESGQRVDFVLDAGNRKRYVMAAAEGRLVVRTPWNFSVEYVQKLIEENLGWINSAVSRSAEKSGLPRTYENGEQIRLLGEHLTISLENSDRYAPVKINGDKLVVTVCPTSDKNYVVREINGFIIDLANREVKESMERLTKLSGLYPKKITLKSLTASWGICSSQGNISINYKLITYPKSHIDYVCMHELCHLKYMNHSKEFWQLVGKYCPDYKQIRESMR